ncbi:histidine triad nucleotide-binding protein 3-like isoform X2 [Chelmon rostratus]|uniref:histidine triad nucleotide-binding protein 3-like isoform X2 n=1 Tax=Chelmon rostratus TaxID=109905 RepID=UPI001BEB1BCE|nr:histidine triad nucleotide-binding protein 3-like isoform X2 [Chelmon rostratus]
MARKSESSEEIQKNCIFCLIAHDLDKETEVIKKNEELVCFRDISPAAPHHYLVVPKQHIHSCHSLHWGHIGLGQLQGITTKYWLGFHQPPYTSVDHLHLHVLAPTSQISHYVAYKFIPRTFRFVTDECVLKHLKDKAPAAKNLESCMLFQ